MNAYVVVFGCMILGFFALYVPVMILLNWIL